MSTDLYCGPNPELMEAQARVCTGPHQSRPLGLKTDAPQPGPILDILLQSQGDDLPRSQRASQAQMGAFLAAMTIRRGFPPKTRWSPAEVEAFAHYRPRLETELSPELRFLLNPESDCAATAPGEEVVLAALRTILAGGHLDYARTRNALKAILAGAVRPALAAAVLIGQRMNLETYDEVRAYLDAVHGPEQLTQVEVDSLTHFGEPFDGAARYFRPTLFVAAVRAALGRPSLLHGVDDMPPKSGITEEKILTALGARTDLSRSEATTLVQDPAVGLAYISQRIYAPQAYALRSLRVHIAKRPPWAATEKAQRLFTCPGKNYMVVGFYHAGYEETLLHLMWDSGLDAGLVIKGEEGSSHFSLRLGKPSTPERKAVNFAQGFHRRTGQRQDFTTDVDPAALGLQYPHSPRPDQISAAAFAHSGLEALDGKQGPIYDRLILNAAMTDHLLGLVDDPTQAVAQARQAIDSGQARRHLQAYLDYTRA
ncbi:MAG: hypothetical protein GKR89_17030 [Candidatus Latescibacteria bacterium]|nr:hypothetical protein [Candidatus Latescibacterota bacterium]